MLVNFPIAFASGLVSFFAPCVLPLLPAYIGYVTGVSVSELAKKGYTPFFKKILITSVFYVLGFSIIFVLLGTAAGSVGILLRRYDIWLTRVGGLIILILGLEFAGILKIPFLAYERRINLPSWSEKLGYFRAFFVGVVFATAWTPCVGAVLGSILTLAAVSGTALKGASLLFVYSLGISIPFLLIALTLASAPKYLGIISARIGVISRVSGIILALLGLALLTNTYKYFNAWIFNIAFKLGYQIK